MRSFPFYSQLDTMKCGIACLQMICSYYGRELKQDFLSDLCHATNEGGETANIHTIWYCHYSNITIVYSHYRILCSFVKLRHNNHIPALPGLDLHGLPVGDVVLLG